MGKLQHALIVVPVSVIVIWEKEFSKWYVKYETFIKKALWTDLDVFSVIFILSYLSKLSLVSFIAAMHMN